jgi:hypothetical protein
MGSGRKNIFSYGPGLLINLIPGAELYILINFWYAHDQF